MLREADGWDAESVRVWAALKNVAEGSGTMVDAAKVMRSIGPDQAMTFLPPRSVLVRDAGGLSRLGDDAFGMVVNELVDPGHAAIVGRLLSDPGEQKALVDLLVKLQPASMSQADSIVRQGIAAGFTREQQFDMFGALDSTSSLFLDRARILERGLGELKKLKQVHGVAAKNAETLERSGSKIDRKASEQETIDNATAIELVQRLAFSAGPVKDIIDAAAGELASGAGIAGIVRKFVRDVRELDFTALARSGGDAVDGRLPDGAGRAGDAVEADGDILPGAGYSREPDGLDGAWPRREEIETGIERGFDPLDPEQGKLFDAPESPGTKLQADNLEHDVKVAAALDAGDIADPAIAARRAIEMELRAGSPLRSTAEQDGSMGLGLFDRADQGELTLRAAADEAGEPRFLVDLGEGEPVERTIGELLDQFGRDDAAIEAARQCL